MTIGRQREKMKWIWKRKKNGKICEIFPFYGWEYRVVYKIGMQTYNAYKQERVLPDIFIIVIVLTSPPRRLRLKNRLTGYYNGMQFCSGNRFIAIFFIISPFIFYLFLVTNFCLSHCLFGRWRSLHWCTYTFFFRLHFLQ